MAEYFTPMERLYGISIMVVQEISFLVPAADLEISLCYQQLDNNTFPQHQFLQMRMLLKWHQSEKDSGKNIKLI